MKVSIIIPVREVNDYIRESIPYINKQTYKDYEIFVFPDVESKESFPNTTIIPNNPSLTLLHGRNEDTKLNYSFDHCIRALL